MFFIDFKVGDYLAEKYLAVKMECLGWQLNTSIKA